MASTRSADVVFARGHAWVGDTARRWEESVAVGGGRILAVGPDRDIRALVGPATRVVELRGRTLLAGFQDAHVHPIHGGIGRLRCDLRAGRTPAQYLEIIATYAAANPDVPWILGGGWSMPDFPGGVPDRVELDRVVPDRPVFLTNRDGHSAWVNGRALEIAGVTADTTDPAHGRIERGADGTPSGALHEGAMALVEDHAPEADAEERLRGLENAQAYLHSLGITAWQDAIVTADDLATYRTLAERGGLTAHVEAALWWDRERGLEQLPELIERAGLPPVPRVRARSVKLMQDGVLETFTGSMIEPYLEADGRPGSGRGIRFIEPDTLAAAVTAIDAAGIQPHFHAIGDQAVRDCLDAVTAARAANGLSDTRPHISHIQVVHPDDVARFRTLGVAANAQPLWACLEPQMVDLTIPFLGPERSGWQYPFRSLRRAGAVLAMGSDWSVSSPNPLLEIEVAVNRVAPDARGSEPFLPHEALDLGDALAAFTSGSAWVNHLDDVTGTVEPGKLADLIVLDRDVFAADAGPIGDARVVATFVDGRPVFEDPALQA